MPRRCAGELGTSPPLPARRSTDLEINGDPGHRFKINYINGIFAWGHRINLLNEMYEKEEAIPISLLGDKVGTHPRSEEHTSELQSRFDIVCRLLLEKKTTDASEAT